MSGCPRRWMVLLAQGASVVDVTCRMWSMLFTPTRTPPIHHCTEGVGTPWKEQLHCSVFSKEQEALSSLAGAVDREGHESSRHSHVPSLPPSTNFSLFVIHKELQRHFPEGQRWEAGTQRSSLSSFLLSVLESGSALTSGLLVLWPLLRSFFSLASLCFVLVHINYTKGFPCDISIHAYSVLWSNSPPSVTHILLYKQIFWTQGLNSGPHAC
jgi:hypothetical protein